MAINILYCKFVMQLDIKCKIKPQNNVQKYLLPYYSMLVICFL